MKKTILILPFILISIFVFAQEEKYTLDSIIYEWFNGTDNEWRGIDKYQFEYDTQGNTLIRSDYWWVGFGGLDWGKVKEIEKAYDSQGRVIQKISRNYDDFTFELGNTTREEITYNSNGDVVLNIAYDEAGTVIGKIEHTYNVDNLLIQRSEFSWNFNIESISEDRRYTYSYNVDGKLEESSLTYFVSNILIGVFQEEYVYNDTGQLIENYTFFLDETETVTEITRTDYSYDIYGNINQELNYEPIDSLSSEWIVKDILGFVFDEDGNQLEFTLSVWDENLSVWYVRYRDVFTYDSNGYQIDYFKQVWNDSLMILSNTTKEEYERNSIGDVETAYYYTWDILNAEWEVSTRREYTYDASILPEQLILPDELGDWHNFKGKREEFVNYFWDDDEGVWLPHLRNRYHYSEQDLSTNVSDVFESDILIYPNPTSNFIVFDVENIDTYSKVQLFDMQGKNVLTRTISPNNRLYVNYLSSGVYLYEFHNDGQVHRGKIVIN